MPRPLTLVLSYKNKWVTDRFKKSAKWFQGTDEDIEILFDDLKRFLWLYATLEEKKKTHPTEDIPDLGFADAMMIIDEMWHAFILYTQFYADFCEEYLGSFMHHPTPIEKYVSNIKTMKELEAKEILVSEMVECVYNYLGEEVAMRWFDEYFKFPVPNH